MSHLTLHTLQDLVPESATSLLLSKTHGILNALSDLLWYAMPIATSSAQATGNNDIKAGGTQTRQKAPDAAEAARLAALQDIGVNADLRLTLGLQV